MLGTVEGLDELNLINKHVRKRTYQIINMLASVPFFLEIFRENKVGLI